ncbi:MAG: hypothetical protein FJ106_01780 [Deltaproteobacteria bacterium]|nr:hypothetical protein [Deltaproteobacteria bacterium]
MDNNITHNDSSLWYIIRTKPGDEHHVEGNLEKQGIEVFLPLVETYRNNHGKMVRVTKPLFTCYIFARLNLNIHYEKVRFTRGVDKILKLSNHSFPISNKVIETLNARTGKGCLNRKEE